jgi:hypothetical protein
MKRSGAAVGSERIAQEAAQAYLQAGGDAVGAVVCGFFAAAGQAPGVLLGPLGLVIAQVGVGVRAFDGRQRQPGLELRRQRGLGPDESAPLAARAAAPGSIAALLVALRYGQTMSVPKVLAAGLAIAKQAGAERRTAVLDQIARLGASALSAPGIARELIHVAGPSEGGALTMADLAATPDVDQPARAAGTKRVAPWAEERLEAKQASAEDWEAQAARQQGLCACDARGGFAALCYDDATAGLQVDALELLLPLNATPPRRGLPRVAPGRFLPAPAPISIELSEQGLPAAAAVALAGRAPLSVYLP